MANKNTGINNLPGLQRSVKKSAAKKVTVAISRRASQIAVERSASPTIASKRKRTAPLGEEEEDDSPVAKKMATDKTVMEALLRLKKKFDAANENLKSCAKKDDLTTIEISKTNED